MPETANPLLHIQTDPKSGPDQTPVVIAPAFPPTKDQDGLSRLPFRKERKELDPQSDQPSEFSLR